MYESDKLSLQEIARCNALLRNTKRTWLRRAAAKMAPPSYTSGYQRG